MFLKNKSIKQEKVRNIIKRIRQFDKNLVKHQIMK